MKPGSTFLFYSDIFMFFFTNGILDLFLLLHKSENDVNKKKCTMILGIEFHVNFIHSPFVLRKMKVIQV